MHRKEMIVIDSTYETTDGKIFDSEISAQHHQKVIDGLRVECDKCGGTGKRDGYWNESGGWGDGSYKREFIIPDCEACSGKGWLEKKVVWE